MTSFSDGLALTHALCIPTSFNLQTTCSSFMHYHSLLAFTIITRFAEQIDTYCNTLFAQVKENPMF